MNKTIEDIIKEWETDCQVDSLALDDSSIKFAKIHAKYIMYLTEFKLKLRMAESKLSEIRHAKWLYYTGKMTKEEMDERKWAYDPFNGNTKPLRSDLDTYVDSDAELRILIDKKTYFQTGVDALTEILDTLRWRHAHIKNCIDWRRFTSGA